MKKTILITDDDHDIVRLVTEALTYEGFKTLSAYTGEEALTLLAEQPVDFVILDIMMPGMDGLETCRRIRETQHVPILLLSARNREIDKIIGLEIGADDYLTKPFSVQELTARVKAHFRRMERMRVDLKSNSPMMYKNHPLLINRHTFEVFVDGKLIDLSAKEFQILCFLADHPNRVLSREQIYDHIWGDVAFGDMNTVTVHIKNLRKKLGKEVIKTVWGVGYKFINEEADK
ncbi:response regulator transcription factor [Marininema halotolerans]|uniref:DNA-binding response regulator, OmpR family, contains REC and winged-helix (WHTH) domain n=1 Tax=Marininema halotolerans TaxID=1155944 RepID=A0A1I6UHG9_9BACL|nr:response regulator transcription factor [Marininema halotolerans]SFT00871.1 DNA-binding response regulator, OmpR family, contains REC and winged-helix (wHTH) domain [Marininema halotolerans]